MLANLEILGRKNALFIDDIADNNTSMCEILANSRVLIVGGAGSIGAAVTKEIFKRSPKCLHVIDISENNLVALVRDIRSSLGYMTDNFLTFCLDIGSEEFDAFMRSQAKYDYILNLSALKHVRSEKDPFSLMRMLETNIFNSVKLHKYGKLQSSEKYFCVSSDKAANPENLMGATKRIMELFAFSQADCCPVSMARFANVAFSDGSLLHGFKERLLLQQPISAPKDIKRYFITPQEAGQLCLLSCLKSGNGEILFPSSVEEINPITFSEIAVNFLRSNSLEPYLCDTEEEARAFLKSKSKRNGYYPCYFFDSDTTGEKSIEEFFTGEENIDLTRFQQIGVVRPDLLTNQDQLEFFKARIHELKNKGSWNKQHIVHAITNLLPSMNYYDNGKYLDGKM